MSVCFYPIQVNLYSVILNSTIWHFLLKKIIRNSLCCFWKQAPPICGQGQAGPRLFLKLAGAGREGGRGWGGAGGRGWGGGGTGWGLPYYCALASYLQVSPAVSLQLNVLEHGYHWTGFQQERGDILCSTCHKGNSHQEKGTKFIFKRPSNSWVFAFLKTRDHFLLNQPIFLKPQNFWFLCSLAFLKQKMRRKCFVLV